MVGFITFFSSCRWRVRVRMMPSWSSPSLMSAASTLVSVVAEREIPSLSNKVFVDRLEECGGAMASKEKERYEYYDRMVGMYRA